MAGNRRTDTSCERLLRSALWRMGLRFRKNVSTLPGKPDVVFTSRRLAVFCDGDFWHGRDWEKRQQKLAHGHNSAYWIAKIRSNRDRDRRHNEDLRKAGWVVLRLWETDILKDPERAAAIVHGRLEELSSGTLEAPRPSA